ncbi:hypothetical protein MQ089_03245 [Edwardsiella anguillarum]|uniref:hypothetical protein n=1 Tax=Edwardsiella anguillarum TaxID=1821960 RepID=UPI0024B646FE|nr:hypothetical protein [Edwardsiella anguillarum]WHP80914.1 hypothetical protein MQ090_03225 [Edwardsiella anguillarum]WHQ18416.1 hypothetical protein MQ085_03245 [Edwardsiella anguillarum]WHQ21955.1 hypothetical protein MQ089_03245 [Edwardsiella anguillarum]WHQ25479.1 hypothetical protein MQ094_03245 [Edwardsiella anguillarum]WHQ29001.1 hypothetical protein MQ093_03245 [Edwardsiella anguillarum]
MSLTTTHSRYLTLLQILSLLLAVGALFYLIEVSHSENALALDSGLSGQEMLDHDGFLWGMNYFLCSLGLGICIPALAFFIGFRYD